MSLYTVYMQCSMYPESPVVNEDMCTRTLLCAYIYMPGCLMTESSSSLDEATSKESMMVTGCTNDTRKDKCKYILSLFVPVHVDFICHAGVLETIELHLFWCLYMHMKSECPWTPNQATMGVFNEFLYPRLIKNILMRMM